MIPSSEILLRLLLAAILGAVVGVERERRDQPAGLRTHTILSIGAALAMILSIELASQFRELVPNGDPARLAAQVISGIGFLGAGAIIRYGPNIKGLTTATSLWTVAVISLAVGAGHYIAAGEAVLLLMAALVLMGALEKRFIRSIVTKTIRLKVRNRPDLIKEVRTLLASLNVEVKSLGIAEDIKDQQLDIHGVVHLHSEDDLDLLVEALGSVEGAIKLEVR